MESRNGPHPGSVRGLKRLLLGTFPERQAAAAEPELSGAVPELNNRFATVNQPEIPLKKRIINLVEPVVPKSPAHDFRNSGSHFPTYIFSPPHHPPLMREGLNA